MNTPDYDALAEPHGERVRWLVSDANPDLAQRDGYRAHLASLASFEPPAPPALIPLAKTLAVIRLGGRNCFYASREASCGCIGAMCHHLGRIVGVRDCAECLKKW